MIELGLDFGIEFAIAMALAAGGIVAIFCAFFCLADTHPPVLAALLVVAGAALIVLSALIR